MRGHVVERFSAASNSDADIGLWEWRGEWRSDAAMGPADPTPMPAAVLVPLVDRSGGMTVLLTRRTDHMPSHAGQISFPGGRIDESDQSPEHTALRETEEEIGLKRDRIEVVGRLSARRTNSGFRVVPVVGLVAPPFILDPDPNEVAQIFEIPLDLVLDRKNFLWESHVEAGRKREYYVLAHGDHRIWGLTAGMLYDLNEVLCG